MSPGSQDLSYEDQQRMIAIAKEFVEFHLEEVRVCRRHARLLIEQIESKRKVPSIADVKACVPTGLSEMALMNVDAALARLELAEQVRSTLSGDIEFEPAPVIALARHAEELAS